MPSGSTQSTEAMPAEKIAFTLFIRKFVYLSAASMPISAISASTNISLRRFSHCFLYALRPGRSSALPSGEDRNAFCFASDAPMRFVAAHETTTVAAMKHRPFHPAQA